MLTPGHRNSIIVITLAWTLVNMLLFQKNGIKIVSDSERYIEYANGLASGFYFDSHNFWYVGYGLYLLLVFKLFGGSIVAAVIGQYLLSFVAVIALYRGTFLLWSSSTAALITCLLFLGFIDISSWNSYILTESLYTSFICFSLFCLITVRQRPVSISFKILTAVVVVFTFFMKPTGIALLVALAAVVLYNMVVAANSAWKKVSIISTAVVVFIILINRMLTTFLLIETYQAGEVIYGVTSFPDQEVVESLIVDRPANIFTPSSAHPVIIRVVEFIFHHPIYWLKLFFLKVYYLLLHTRPFWSGYHNMFSLAVLVPSYFLFSGTLRSAAVDRDVVIFSISFVLVHILSVGITSDDWDGRFLMPMLPVIFIFAGRGIEVLSNKYLRP